MVMTETLIRDLTETFQSAIIQGKGGIVSGDGSAYPHMRIMPEGTSDWIFILLVLSLCGISIILYNFNHRFRQSIQTFFQFYNLHQFTRDGNFISERTGIFLYGIFLIGLSMFTYQANFFLGDSYIFVDSGISLFVKIFIGYTLFFLTKSGIYFISGRIFETREASFLVILDDFIISCVNGLILLPILFITTYSPTPAIFIAGLSILGLTFIYRMIRAVAIGLSVSQFSLFYLFLYLCSLEIVPVMVIGKILAGNSQI
ncbi:MAG: hypothetical protein C0593_10250 [Marinilabiliales bacterium]|nr:MAG: hypothetical protein C0593_10250 [Marinilabiliales bacterium]